MATKPTTSKPTKSAAKPGARAAKPKPASAEGEPGPAVAEGGAKGVAGLRLKDLVDKVAASTDVKKKDVKTVVEATLLAMGAALKAGESLNLAGLGRMRVARAGNDDGGAMTLKLRMGGPAAKGEKPAAAPLAAAEDQD